MSEHLAQLAERRAAEEDEIVRAVAAGPVDFVEAIKAEARAEAYRTMAEDARRESSRVRDVTVEYTPASAPRRRLVFESDPIAGRTLREDEWTGCNWRTVGREPVRDVDVEEHVVRGHEAFQAP
ncbi:hypothetical protein [Haloprofundus salilacus]|uniref:hypothetical protein n=1 Tax=Haloprofundus salilacus TaxID=2876190 RepID=UPI001CCE9EA9|nr:hypothetical protein [Haloprofundus salilacus]